MTVAMIDGLYMLLYVFLHDVDIVHLSVYRMS